MCRRSNTFRCSRLSDCKTCGLCSGTVFKFKDKFLLKLSRGFVYYQSVSLCKKKDSTFPCLILALSLEERKARMSDNIKAV